MLCAKSDKWRNATAAVGNKRKCTSLPDYNRGKKQALPFQRGHADLREYHMFTFTLDIHRWTVCSQQTALPLYKTWINQEKTESRWMYRVRIGVLNPKSNQLYYTHLILWNELRCQSRLRVYSATYSICWECSCVLTWEITRLITRLFSGGPSCSSGHQKIVLYNHGYMTLCIVYDDQTRTYTTQY